MYGCLSRRSGRSTRVANPVKEGSSYLNRNRISNFWTDTKLQIKPSRIDLWAINYKCHWTYRHNFKFIRHLKWRGLSFYWLLTPSVFNKRRGENRTMPKIKTNRSAAKRFKKTGTGKVVFAKSCASHIMTKKTTKRKRSLRRSQIVDSADMKEIRQLLPNG